MENATSADKNRGSESVKGTPTTIIPIAANANGIGTTAAGTATIIQPKANAIGIWGKIRCIMAPKHDPINNRGNIGPPIKPKFNAPLNAIILANANTKRSTIPIVAACWVTTDIWVVPSPIVVGIATASKPNNNPPNVLRMTGLLFNGSTRRLIILFKIPKIIATGTATSPNTIPTPRCQISKW